MFLFWFTIFIREEVMFSIYIFSFKNIKKVVIIISFSIKAKKKNYKKNYINVRNFYIHEKKHF